MNRRLGPGTLVSLLVALAMLGPFCVGCGQDKSLLPLNLPFSASTAAGQETLFSYTAVDTEPLFVSANPWAPSLVLEVIDEGSGEVLAAGTQQMGILGTSFIPEAGASLCIRFANESDADYTGEILLEPAPTAVIVSLSTPPGGDALMANLQNRFDFADVNCQEALVANPGTGSWTFVFDATDPEASGPYRVGFTLLEAGAVIAFGASPPGSPLPAAAGVVSFDTIQLVASGGMPIPPPQCPAVGMLPNLVPPGSYGTSDLRN